MLTISIVSWNTRDLLRICLTSLAKYCCPEHTRVIVADNASSDGTPEMVRREFPNVTLIETGGNLGFGKAHNLVIVNSREPVILFLNPDTEFISDAHKQMLRVFEQHPEVAAVGCRLCNPGQSVQPLGFQWRTSPWTEVVSNLLISRTVMPFAQKIFPYHDPLTDGEVRKLYGGCLMVRRSALDQIGMFDERFFMYAEDVDLCRRILDGGWRLYYLASASIIHVGGGASAKAPGRFAVQMQCESLAAFMLKYYGKWGRALYVGAILIRAVTRLSVVIPACGLTRLAARRSTTLEGSRRKLTAMLNWSLGLERPAIPV